MAATVNYQHPVVGTTAPTALQAKERVTFTINDITSADVTIIVTHNMAISAADLAAGSPIVILEPLRASAWSSQWLVGSAALPGATGKTTDTIQLTRVVSAGDTGTAVAQIRVTLLRPHTIGR